MKKLNDFGMGCWVHKRCECVCGWIWMESLKNVLSCGLRTCRQRSHYFRRSSRQFRTGRIADHEPPVLGCCPFRAPPWLPPNGTAFQRFPCCWSPKRLRKARAANYCQPLKWELIELSEAKLVPENKSEKCHVNKKVFVTACNTNEHCRKIYSLSNRI